MNAPTLIAPEYKEGFQVGFHEGLEQARLQSKVKESAAVPKKEEEKPSSPRPSPFHQTMRDLMGNRVFQLVAGIVVLLHFARLLIGSKEKWVQGNHSLPSLSHKLVISSWKIIL
jgi:hypothetical protein